MNPPPIKGPYKFGHDPPRHLMGYDADTAKREAPKSLTQLPPPPSSTAVTTCPPIHPWTIVKDHNNQRHIPTVEQETGDCVAAAIAQVLRYLTALQILTDYREQTFHPPHISYIYGISRVQIGGGRIPGPGSTGAWGAAAVQEYGCLFLDDPGAPPYSGSLSDKWGRRPGPPAPLQKIAADNKVIRIQRLNNSDQIHNALCNRALVTIASGRGFRMEPYQLAGHHVFQPQGNWPHQMCFISCIDKPFPAAYRLNSWGPDAHGTPLQGEPPGGAWNLAPDINEEIHTYDPEIYAFSLFDAHPNAADHNIIWIPKDLENVQTPPDPRHPVTP